MRNKKKDRIVRAIKLKNIVVRSQTRKAFICEMEAIIKDDSTARKTKKYNNT
jgi:hypothetical protein